MSASKIVKAPPGDESPSAPSVVVKRAIVDANAEAARIIAEAEKEVAELRCAAEFAAREARERAYHEGLESALLELNQHLIDACETRRTVLADAEADLLRLAVRIAEKIIGHEINRSDSTVVDIVGTALRHARESEVVTVKINPSDAATLQKYRKRLEPQGRVRYMDFSPDPAVKPGGCLIVTETGTVDAQLETQLRVIERALLARAKGSSS